MTSRMTRSNDSWPSLSQADSALAALTHRKPWVSRAKVMT